MKSKIFIALFITVFIWIVFLLDFIIPIDFVKFGIQPRTFSGLFGIVFAPFLHASWGHILSNTLPLFFLTLALFVFYEKQGITVWALSAIIGGILVWLFARPHSVHVGASGVIFSLVGFLIASGFFRKNIKSILISLLIAIVYGGILLGMGFFRKGVSWEGHLFGLIAGVFLAFVFGRKSKKTAVKQ